MNIKPILPYITGLVRCYSRDEMSVYAAQASFFILLAACPFFMLLIALLDLIPLVQDSDLLTFLVQVMPDSLDALVINMVEHIRSGPATTLLSVSALAAVWSSSRGMLSIERGLNRAFSVDVQRNYLVRRLVCSGYTLLFTLGCGGSLLLLVFGSSLADRLLALWPDALWLRVLIMPVRSLLALFLLTAIFLAFYVILPYRRQTIRGQLPGALLSAIGWVLFSLAFSLYFRHMGNLTPVYGNLTAVVLMMLWLYFCICILFFGAELNAANERYGK